MSVLPMGCSTQFIDGNIYYVRNNTYFRRTRGGYIVVRKPCANLVIPARTETRPLAKQTVTVWIQNSNGSRTPVKITPTTDGQWVGPKGEYYEDFPAKAQLKSIYGLEAE
ncbi:MAG: hypothetical protein KAI66_05480 [Lentisphaeria bacterium]|nr:hypothetical protein [Lentisphaeria bacterium]